MIIFPAIDLRDGKVVRLLKGDYNKMTVYGDDPVAVAKSFFDAGARYLHLVDLDGAKDGKTPAFEIAGKIVNETNLKVEIGGGIRSEEIIEKYINAGVMRVILGTIAVKDPEFTRAMIKKYKEKIAIGVDLNGDKVAISGWRETSSVTADEIFAGLERDGAKTVICTDISKDGAMAGTNRDLYKSLSEKYSINIVASGGVSTMEDVKALREMNLYGAIIGKALYQDAIDLSEAIKEASK